MRKELYEKISRRLQSLYRMEGEIVRLSDGEMPTEDGERLIKHIDLWNHNVEFIEQETNWERPAVFVEFTPIKWETIVPGTEYRAEPEVRLHIVTDWKGASSADSEFREEALEVFDLPKILHRELIGMNGRTFMDLDLAESLTNHDHEEIVETIEVYQCVVFMSLK